MNGFSNTMQGPVGFQVTITAPAGREFLIPGVVKFVVPDKRPGVTLVFFSDEHYKKVLYHLDKYGFTYTVEGYVEEGFIPQPGDAEALVEMQTWTL
jgi:hypothetical protein